MLRMAFTLLICILIVGFYLGWFSFTKSAPDPQSNKVNVNVSVDKQKMGADLTRFERNVAQRLENINSQPQGSAAPLPARQPVVPGLNFGPITVQPSNLPGQTNNGQPALSIGPFSVQGTNPALVPRNAPATSAPQVQDFQFTVPLNVPPPGDGR